MSELVNRGIDRHWRGEYRRKGSPDISLSPTSPPLGSPKWNQAKSPTKCQDYAYLARELYDTKPGSKRNFSSRPSFRRLQSGEDSGVLDSDIAKPVYDQELKILHKLKSGEFDIPTVEQYRQSLVKKKEFFPITKKQGNMAKLKSAARVAGMLIKNTPNLDILMAEVAHSPLNPNRPRNHIEMMERLRRLRYEGVSMEESDINCRSDDEESGAVAEVPESPDVDRKTSKIEKGKKYVVASNTPSPFLNDEGKPLPVVNSSNKKKSKSSEIKSSSGMQSLQARARLKASIEERKRRKARSSSDPQQPEVTTSDNKNSAKLPRRLRKKCAKEFRDIYYSTPERASDRSWEKIKRQDSRRVTLKDTMVGLSPKQEEETQLKSPNLNTAPSTESLAIGFPDSSIVEPSDEEGYLLGINTDGLLTVDELDELSVASGNSGDYVKSGNDAGLFSFDELMNLHIDENDPIATENRNSPENVLAGCFGRLLFAEQGSPVKVRPASAGIGGISKARILTADPHPSSFSREQVRPKSAFSCSEKKSFKVSQIDERPHPHITRKRNVVNRNMPTERWIS
mmetsp:Transcript_12353/g.18732  ORF Transcript_12353/g.18732 Transcript_12353/m.18732 type:complete len:568 (-) Transcript_12353:94-1797(-)